MYGGIQRCSDYSLTQVKSKEVTYTWKISNFKSLHPGLGKWLGSNKVSDDEEAVWDVQLYADGYRDGFAVYDNYIAINVSFTRFSEQVEYPIYLLLVYIVDKNGEEREMHKVNSNQMFTAKLVSKTYLFDEKNGLLPNGDLTLRFKTHFTSEALPKYINKFEASSKTYHVYHKSKLNIFINFIRKNFTYFSAEVVHTPKLSKIMESKLDALERILNNERFSDLLIVSGGKEFYVYKGIMATQSPVFAAMFEHDMRESNENIVRISDFDQEVVQEMLRFIYVGTVNNLDAIARDLLALADKYEIEQLKLICEETLINDLNVDTVTSLLILADQFGAATLKRSALEFFVFKAKEIIRTNTYKANLNSLLPLLPEILENLVL